MSYIVGRLRSAKTSLTTMAAMEIECLRAEKQRLQALLKEVLDDEPMYKIDRMTAEKIRTELKHQMEERDVSKEME